MNLIKMSFFGAVFIAAVTVIRTAAGGRLPKRTFPVLWELVLARLLLPFSIPFRFSLYSFLPALSTTETGNTPPVMFPIMPQEQQQTMPLPLSADTVQTVSVWRVVWWIGAILLALFFTLSYMRCLQKFRIAYPVRSPYVQNWLKAHPLKRRLSIRQSDSVSAPLTYGIFRPVILLPIRTDWQNQTQLQYVLLHEYVHVRRFDAAKKLIMIAALCVHWFNPTVWIMYFLFNRDLELSCDERVIRTIGETSKSAYALMLIEMEAKKSDLHYHHSYRSCHPRIGGRVRHLRRRVRQGCGDCLYRESRGRGRLRRCPADRRDNIFRL